MKSNALLTSSVCVVAALSATSALAQKAAAGATQLDEIVVTAERRTQNLQDIPIAVSAISADVLDAHGVADIRQLQDLAPSVRIIEVGQQPSIQIRGVGSVVTNVANDPSISFSIDDVPIARPVASTSGMFDLQRVEILKGPQGTLYGRNATGGAINVLTRKPVHENEALASIRIGNYNLIQSSLIGNWDASETLAIRAGIQKVGRDGYLSNGADDADSLAGRVRVLWDATDRVSLLLNASWSRIGGMGPGDVPLKNNGSYLDPAHPFALATNAGTPNGLYQDGHFGNSVPGFGQYQKIKSETYSAELNWDAGPVRITVIPAYIDLTYKATTFNSGFTQNINSGDTQKSFEARISSQIDGPLSWIVGGYLLRDNQFAYNDNHLAPTTRSFSTTPYLNLETYAFFGQATYALTDQLNATAGLRYTNDHKTTQLAVRSSDLTGLTGTTQTSFGDQKWGYTSYRVGLDYHLTKDNLIYANVSDGYKAGGINRGEATGPAGPAGYEPEHLISYQFGSRNEFFGGKVRFNAEAWYWDYRSLQLNSSSCINIPGGTGGGAFNCPAGTIPATVTRNVGTVSNKGIETETLWRATRNDLVALNLTYNLGKYVEAFLFPATLNGQVTPRTPLWSGSASYTHTFNLASGAKFDAQISDRFESKSDRFVTSVIGQKEARWHSVSAEIAYTVSSKAWTIALWGDNLNNDDHVVFANQGFAGVWGHATPPRTYGIRANVKL